MQWQEERVELCEGAQLMLAASAGLPHMGLARHAAASMMMGRLQLLSQSSKSLKAGNCPFGGRVPN